jgi:hypothetical protein
MVCSAAAIRDLKDNHHTSVDSLSWSKIYDQSCSKTTSSNNLNVSVPVEGVPVSFGGTSNNLRAACATHDKAFFEKYRVDLIASTLSDPVKLELIRNCAGGLTLHAKENPNSIVLDIYGRSKLGGALQIVSFKVDPPNAARVNDPEAIKPGTPIVPDGRPVTFTRIAKNDVITFTLITNEGYGKNVIVPGVNTINVSGGILKPQ